MPAGRPRKYKSPKDFDKAVDLYCEQCTQLDLPLTITGLALALGFYGRQELANYAEYEEFSDSVKRARALVENAYELRLHGNSPTGAIFALKNMGWLDKQAQEISGPGGGAINVRDVDDLSDEELRRIAASGK